MATAKGEAKPMITNPTITVDAKNKLPHGTVRRAPTGFAHAILLDQMGEEAKWHIIDLYGPMETETDTDVEDWPIVYVPVPDEVWNAMNNQLSYRDRVAEEFGAYKGPLHAPECTEDQSACMEQADQEFSSADAPKEGRTYPRSAFVTPCKNCDHKQWIHDRETGECHGRVYLPDAACACSGFEEASEPSEVK
jgi:hypothetical protein